MKPSTSAKFKIGDEVVPVSSKYFGDSVIGLVGVVTYVYDSDVTILVGSITQDYCTDWGDALVRKDVYNSPLYQALL